MKFQSKIFIHYFTFSLIPNMIILLFLLILYQRDVENSLRKNISIENQSFSLLYDLASQNIKRSNFPYPINNALKRYLHSTSDDKITFYTRGDKHYFRFVCDGRQEILCDIIQVDSISWIHRLGLTNIFLCLTGINLIIVFLTAIFVSRMIVSPIDKIMAWINSSSNSKLNKKFNIQEVDLLAFKLEAAIEKERDFVEAKKLAAIGTIATQVAHDIRGPLSSMQAAMSFFSDTKVRDEKFTGAMNLLQLSAQRLRNVADGLLQKHKGTEERSATFSLYRILDELSGEYHGQYHDVRFVKQYTSSPVELCGDAGKLQRAFGNIIKNAVEAMRYKGTITLHAELRDHNVIVAINDTGSGMPPEILKQVLKGGYTEGKQDGHGIGTQVVRQTVEEYKGKLSVQSQEDKGTTFFITLPLSEQISHEKLTIHVQENEPIIIIDDDPSLREQWHLMLKEKGKRTLLCESYEDFQNQKITTNISQTAVVDYHFDNSELNGGDVLAILKQQGFTNLYLCTAEYWKPSVQKMAEDLGVILCPKPLPRIVIVNLNNDVIASSERAKQSPMITDGDCFVATAPRNDKESCHDKKSGYTVLVIDDDEGVRMSWEMMKDKLQIKNLRCYSNMEEMQSNGVDLQKVDIAFVDKNIEGSAFSGAAVLSFLKEKCAGKLVLASGENEKELRKDPQFNNADFITQDKVPSSLSKFLI